MGEQQAVLGFRRVTPAERLAFEAAQRVRARRAARNAERAESLRRSDFEAAERQRRALKAFAVPAGSLRAAVVDVLVAHQEGIYMPEIMEGVAGAWKRTPTGRGVLDMLKQHGTRGRDGLWTFRPGSVFADAVPVDAAK